MSIWNALTGGKTAQHVPPSPTSSPDSSAHHQPPSQQQQQQQHTFPSTTPSPPPPAVDGGAGEFLQSSAFADPTQLHPLAGLDRETLDYISLEDATLAGPPAVLPSRGFTDDLCYGTGITYLSGLTIGGAWGLQEGLRRSRGMPPKLTLNSVLNAVTRRGPFLGNSAGVVAITYNCINSYIAYVRGYDDAAGSVTAGALSGMLFKSTRGLRPMLISGGIVASVAAAWTLTRRTFFTASEPELHA